MVSGATVFFTHNGNPVSIEEKSPGRYLPVSEELPEKGDSFYIEVMWEGKAVSATARIPDYPVEEMVVQPETSARVSHIRLDHYIYPLPVALTIPFLPAFTAVQTISEYEKSVYKEAGFEQGTRCDCPWEYQTYFEDTYPGDFLSLNQTIRVMLPVEDHESEPPASTVYVPFKVTVKIPEPIYVDYVRTRYDEIGVITVTNVEGGVGLFMGAIRYVKEMSVEVNVE